MVSYDIITDIPVYMSNTTFSTINTIETRNWNRRLSPRNMSIIYDLVNVWHRRIDSTIQMLSSNTPTTDSNPDTNGIYQCDIQDNIGSIKYQYIMDEEGRNALFVLHIDFNLPWNLGSGRLNIRENKQNITMKNTKNRIRLTESQLQCMVKEAIKHIMNETEVSSRRYGKKEGPNDTISIEFKTLCDRIEHATGLKCELIETNSEGKQEMHGYDNYSYEICLYGVLSPRNRIPIKELNTALKMCKAFNQDNAEIYADGNNALIMFGGEFKDYAKFPRLSNKRVTNRELISNI